MKSWNVRIIQKGISLLLICLLFPLMICMAGTDLNGDMADYYSRVLEAVQEGGYTAPDGVLVRVSADSYTNHEGMKPTQGSLEGSILQTEETSSVTWTVELPQTGLYWVVVSYFPADGATLSPSRKILINGEQPFREASRIVFGRRWVDEGDPVKNVTGDEVCPVQQEISVWSEKALNDSQGKNAYPLQFLMQAGRNTITFEYIGEPLELEWLSVCSVKETPTYAEVSENYTADAAKERLRIEAEARKNVAGKSEASILPQPNSDPTVTPYEATQVRLNTIGAYSWSEGHQEISWKLEVPETGLYQIHLRVLQNWNNGLSSYRSLRINGKIPFSEMGCVTFRYDTAWQNCVLGDENGTPYLFELTKGENILSMQVEFGKAAEIAQELSDVAGDLSDVIFDITRITGYTPDPNYNYHLETEIPGLMDRLQSIRQQIEHCRQDIHQISGKNSTMEGNLKSAVSDLNRLIDRPTFLPTKLADLNTMLTNLSDWSATLQTGPLAIDYLELLPPGTKVTQKNATFWQRIWATLKNFRASFTKDYNAVSGNAGKEDPLDVWISRSTRTGHFAPLPPHGRSRQPSRMRHLRTLHTVLAESLIQL